MTERVEGLTPGPDPGRVRRRGLAGLRALRVLRACPALRPCEHPRSLRARMWVPLASHLRGVSSYGLFIQKIAWRRYERRDV